MDCPLALVLPLPPRSARPGFLVHHWTSDTRERAPGQLCASVTSARAAAAGACSGGPADPAAEGTGPGGTRVLPAPPDVTAAWIAHRRRPVPELHDPVRRLDADQLRHVLREAAQHPQAPLGRLAGRALRRPEHLPHTLRRPVELQHLQPPLHGLRGGHVPYPAGRHPEVPVDGHARHAAAAARDTPRARPRPAPPSDPAAAARPRPPPPPRPRPAGPAPPAASTPGPRDTRPPSPAPRAPPTGTARPAARRARPSPRAETSARPDRPAERPHPPRARPGAGPRAASPADPPGAPY